MELKITQKENTFYLEGSINEFAKFQPILDFQDSPLVLNLKNLTRINSMGVREWINMIENIDPKIQVIMEECPPIIVYQMDMIPNFHERAKIRSVYAPYYCPECEKQTLILVEMKGFDLDNGLPVNMCPECEVEMLLDDDEESFFYFNMI